MTLWVQGDKQSATWTDNVVIIPSLTPRGFQCPPPPHPTPEWHSTQGRSILLTQKGTEGDQAGICPSARGYSGSSIAHPRLSHSFPTGMKVTILHDGSNRSIRGRGNQSVISYLAGHNSKREQRLMDSPMTHLGTPRNSLEREVLHGGSCMNRGGWRTLWVGNCVERCYILPQTSKA